MTPKTCVMLIEAWRADAHLYRIDDPEVLTEIEKETGKRPFVRMRVRVLLAMWNHLASDALFDSQWTRAAELLARHGLNGKRQWQPLNKGHVNRKAQQAAQQRAATLEHNRDFGRGRWGWKPENDR